MTRVWATPGSHLRSAAVPSGPVAEGFWCPSGPEVDPVSFRIWILLLDIYAKNEKEDLSINELT